MKKCRSYSPVPLTSTQSEDFQAPYNDFLTTNKQMRYLGDLTTKLIGGRQNGCVIAQEASSAFDFSMHRRNGKDDDSSAGALVSYISR
jgi:hypothetical protein